MTAQDELLYERELQIAASPETIFPFLIEPEKLTRWMGIDATLEARPSGVFRVEVRPDNIARGEFVQVEPNSRVVFTWGWEQGGTAHAPPGSTRVEITLIPNEPRYDAALRPQWLLFGGGTGRAWQGLGSPPPAVGRGSGG